ncbi:uncharacterized protein LOC103100041 [Monodelphis domestica]|uniref:uncharacterized protein LOC103100041 n=1 Tax=Monodelphis domestica TaxID=13616 RepID=UPI0024E2350D|nr:uncharacterized protein LOC103100041 [Monodelphis domestica]
MDPRPPRSQSIPSILTLQLADRRTTRHLGAFLCAGAIPGPSLLQLLDVALAMVGQFRADSEFGRRAPGGFLTQWPGPGVSSCPDPDREPHCAPIDAGPPRPKRRRGNPCLRPPCLAPGTLRGSPWLPQGPLSGVTSLLGSATLAVPMPWAPACLRKPLERPYQNSVEERQESRNSLKQKNEKETLSVFSVDVEETPENFLTEKKENRFFQTEARTACSGFLEAEEREPVTKIERDWSSHQELRENPLPLCFPSFPRERDGVLSIYPKLNCFSKNGAESKSMDVDVQEKHDKPGSPFAQASSPNATRMERILKTWQHWCSIPFEGDMVMEPLSIYPENSPWPASVAFLGDLQTSPVYLYGNQNIFKKDKWPHYIRGSKTPRHPHPRCCQGA